MKKKYKIVDHMINVTYPLVRDTRLLLSSVENIFLTMTNAMGALLHYDRLYKKIPPFNDTFDSKYFMYTRLCQEKYDLNPEFAILMRDIKKIIVEHKKSPVVFSRKDKYVICTDTYQTNVLTYNKIRGHLNNLFTDSLSAANPFALRTDIYMNAYVTTDATKPEKMATPTLTGMIFFSPLIIRYVTNAHAMSATSIGTILLAA